MQRALVFLGVVSAALLVGWLAQSRQTLQLQSELSAISQAPTDPGSIVRVESGLTLGPGGVDSIRVSCPAGYRIVYGAFHSLSPDSDVFFADTFGSARTWSVGLDNSASDELGDVTAVAACSPADRAPSARAERTARKRVTDAVAKRRGDDYW